VARGTLGEARAETATLAQVLDALPQGVWITDRTGTVIRHNQALAELLDAPGRLLGARPLEVMRHQAFHDAVLAACTQGQAQRIDVEGSARAPKLQVHLGPLGAGLAGSVAVFQDVTALRALEQVRKDFVSNVSHELRTPITAILGYAETLQGGALGDPAHAPAMVETIHRQAQRLAELVEELLELSELEAQARPLEPVRIKLALIATRAKEAVTPQAARKPLTLAVDVAEELEWVGDARALERILLNLLDNAVKYTPPGGTVTLRAQSANDRLMLSVRDTGVGLEPKHLPRIFERFYRVDKGRSRDQGGTGLGLSIVKHLAAALGGDVQVNSRPGAGSTFTVLLPLAPVPTPPVG
jgi:two-component system, OmpR family, phosphate regulon sensor histidine kinase PhoR